MMGEFLLAQKLDGYNKSGLRNMRQQKNRVFLAIMSTWNAATKRQFRFRLTRFCGGSDLIDENREIYVITEDDRRKHMSVSR